MKKNYAFISYSHQDLKIAKWLHRKLESYRLPTEIHNEFENSKYLRPIFRDQEDLNTGILSEELQKHLENSKFLIVICSPNSAKSEWVNSEVRTFIEWGRLEYIIPFVVDDSTHNYDQNDFYPSSLYEFIKKHPNQELLGISLQEIGREKAFVRVVSKMLGVSFDELWKRHEREQRRRIITSSLGILFLSTLIYYFAFPISLNIHLNDDHHQLPLPDDASLVIDGIHYSLGNLDTTLTLNSIPGYYRGKTISVLFSATYYNPISKNILLGFGMRKSTSLHLKRDMSFAIFSGNVYDDVGKPVCGAEVVVGDSLTWTDKNGFFMVRFHTEMQTETKKVSIRKEGMIDFVREDECPGEDLRYILHSR